MSGAMRGQPVVALLAVLCGWLGGRLSAWEAEPSTIAAPVQAAVAGAQAGYRLDPVIGPQTPAGGLGAPIGAGALGQGYGVAAGELPQGQTGAFPSGAVYAVLPYAVLRAMGLGRSAAPSTGPIHAPTDTFEVNGQVGDPGREYLREPVSALSHDRLPAGLPSLQSLSTTPSAGARPADASPGTSAAAIVPRLKRWSVDAWALLRGSGPGPLANGALPATYGASQAGAVLHYRLATRSAYRPEVYMRSTATLQQLQRETAAALGIAARPLPAVPVVAALEGRLTEQAGRRRVQAVAMAITALPPFELPSRLRGEAYGQAGYVAGEFATPFAEGQLRVDRPLLRLGGVESRLGGGIWGGVQKGAGRLDAGPSASVMVPLPRGVFGRLGVDWRFRVAGDAEPGSGPAVTLSAGF